MNYFDFVLAAAFGTVALAVCFAPPPGMLRAQTPPVPPVPPVPPAHSGQMEAGERDRGPKVPITFLGVETSDVPSVVAEQLGLAKGFGLVVDYVVPDGPAAAAGVQQNDIIKLLNDQIRITERSNIVESRKFREAPEYAMLRYTTQAISTAEMITRLIDLAKRLRGAQKHGEALGLSSEETAFYDALAESESARAVMQSDTLRLMARDHHNLINA